ncbi:MAG TPA: AlkA N-terminal domain-containing protein [Ktedonobacteraceae bacterium]|nr:AlkA N-terminal domain-containing protein [Ktedonobacteraceae bacterium]
MSDLSLLVQRCQQLFDLDADPSAITQVLAADLMLAPLVTMRPGLRIPGAVSGFELAVRAILGQQVSVAGARTLAGRLVKACGEPVSNPLGTLTHLFSPQNIQDHRTMTPSKTYPCYRCFLQVYYLITKLEHTSCLHMLFNNAFARHISGKNIS